MKTIIKILEWGDFDILVTKSIVVSPKKENIEQLKQEFCVAAGIPSFRGLHYRDLESYNDLFIDFLKDKGFTELKTTRVYFCD